MSEGQGNGRSREAPPHTPSGEEPQVGVDWSTEPPPVYANGAHSVYTQRDFALVFTEIAGFAGRGSAEGSVQPRARVVGSLRLTPDVFFQCVVTFASAWNKFIQRFGDPHSTPRFKLIGGQGLQLEGLEAPEHAQDDDEG